MLLDGFPTTLAQAVKLESALSASGQAIEVKESKVHGLVVEFAKEKSSKERKTKLAANPRPPPPASEPVSFFDAVLHFDVDDDTVMRRAAGFLFGVESSEQFHVEFNPPPDGAYTGLGREQVVPARAAAKPAAAGSARADGDSSQPSIAVAAPLENAEQLQQRIVSFGEGFNKLERLYTKFGKLQRIDARAEPNTLYEALKNTLEQTLFQVLRNITIIVKIEIPIYIFNKLTGYKHFPFKFLCVQMEEQKRLAAEAAEAALAAERAEQEAKERAAREAEEKAREEALAAEAAAQLAAEQAEKEASARGNKRGRSGSKGKGNKEKSGSGSGSRGSSAGRSRSPKEKDGKGDKEKKGSPAKSVSGKTPPGSSKGRGRSKSPKGAAAKEQPTPPAEAAPAEEQPPGANISYYS